MSARFDQVGRQRALAMYADWTDRIANGELPSADAAASAGPRAQRRRHALGLGRSEGVPARRDRERQAQSDRATRTARSMARSKRAATTWPFSIRRPTRRARSSCTPRDPQTPSSVATKPAAPSPYWGDEAIWNSKTTVHSFAMDKQGSRVGRGARPQARRRRRGAARDRIIRRRSCSPSPRASAAWSSTTRKPKRPPPSTPASPGAT